MRRIFLIPLLLVPFNINAQRNGIDDCSKSIVKDYIKVDTVLANRFIVLELDAEEGHNHVKEIADVFDCRNNKSLFEYIFCFSSADSYACLSPFCDFTVKGEALTVIHYGNLPTGKNFAYEKRPVFEQTFQFTQDTIFRVSSRCTAKLPTLSQGAVESILQEYETLRKKRPLYTDQKSIGEVSTMMGKLFVCAMQGHTEAKKAWSALVDDLPDSAIGENGPLLDQWMYIYSQCR